MKPSEKILNEADEAQGLRRSRSEGPTQRLSLVVSAVLEHLDDLERRRAFDFAFQLLQPAPGDPAQRVALANAYLVAAGLKSRVSEGETLDHLIEEARQEGLL